MRALPMRISKIYLVLSFSWSYLRIVLQVLINFRNIFSGARESWNLRVPWSIWWRVLKGWTTRRWVGKVFCIMCFREGCLCECSLPVLVELVLVETMEEDLWCEASSTFIMIKVEKGINAAFPLCLWFCMMAYVVGYWGHFPYHIGDMGLYVF